MSGNFKKEDLRISKTYKALLSAIKTTLERRNFRRITVNDLCEGAQLGRATFYSHFKDKYDLLEYALKVLHPYFEGITDSYECFEEIINEFVREYPKIITNVIDDADTETIEILHRFFISILKIPNECENSGELNQKNIVLSNFYAGGILNLLIWQKKNDYPLDLQMANKHSYSLLKYLLSWDE